MDTKAKHLKNTVLAHKGLLRFLTLLLAIAFSGCLISYTLSATVLNETFTKNIVDQPENKTAIGQTLRNAITQTGVQNGVPNQVAEGLLDDETVNRVVDQTVINVYQGKTDPIPTSLIQNTIKTKINSLLPTSLGISLDGVITVLNQNVKQYLDNNVQGQATQVSQQMTMLQKTAKLTTIITAIISILLAVIMLILSRARFFGLQYIGWGVLWAGLLNLVAYGIIALNDQMAIVATYGRDLQEVAQNWVKAANHNLLLTSSAVALVGIILVVVFGILKRRDKV